MRPPVRIDALAPVAQGAAWAVRAGGRTLGRVDAGVPAALGLRAGVVVDGEAWTQLAAALERRAAYEAGSRLLAARPYSRAALQARLARRFGAGPAAAAVGRLAAYLDDGAFAAAWVEERLRRAPAGRPALLEGLRRRGVPVDVARAAVDAASGGAGAERERCLRVAQGRAAKLAGLPPRAAAARLAAFLARRGFRSGDIWSALRAVGFSGILERGGGPDLPE